MIPDNDLPFRLLADVVRIGAVVSMLAAFVLVPSVAAGLVFALVLVALLVPRVVGGVPPLLDLALGATLLTAGWSSVAGWAAMLPGAELLVHASTTGVTAATLHVVLARVGLIGDRVHGDARRRGRVLVRTLAMGLGIGVVWEAHGWFTALALPSPGVAGARPVVAFLVAGAFGALAAGVGLVL